jgi:hypothetical protein
MQISAVITALCRRVGSPEPGGNRSDRPISGDHRKFQPDCSHFHSGQYLRVVEVEFATQRALWTFPLSVGHFRE